MKGGQTVGMTNRVAIINWASVRKEIHYDNLSGAEDILKDIYDSLTQVTLASDFLMIEMDHERSRSELQLSCLIRERALSIRDQVIRLGRALDKELDCSIEH
jgi:hypothetical protein